MPAINLASLQKLPTVAAAQGPSPQLQAAPTGAASLEALGEQVQRSAGVAARFAIEAKQRADLAVVEDAETQLERSINDTLLGTEQTQGYLSEAGHNALEKAGATLEGLRKRQAEIAKGLASDGQRAAFTRRTNGRLVSAEARVRGHLDQQRQVVEGQAFEGKRLESLRTIHSIAEDPAAVGVERQRMEPLVMLEAKRRGLEGWQTYPPKADTPAAAFLNSWRGDVAKTVLGKLISRDDVDGAQAYLDTPIVAGGPTARQVLGSDADQVDAKIAATAEKLDAFDAATEAVELARDKKTGRVDETAARAAVAKVPRLYRKEARANLEGLLNAESESWKRTLGDVYNRASAAYYGGPDGKGKRGLGAISGEDRAFLVKNDLWHHLVTRARVDAESARGAPPSRDQELTFSRIATELVDESTRGKYLGMTGEQFDLEVLSKVAPRDRRALLGQFLQAKGLAVKPDETLPGQVMHEIVQIGRESGAFPPKGAPDTWGVRAAVHANVVRELLQFQADEKKAGRTIDPKKWTEEIAKRFRKVEVQGTGILSDDVVTAAEAAVLPDYEDKEAVEVIPDATRKKILADLRAQGVVEAEENIRFVYERKMGRDVPVPPTFKKYDPSKTEAPRPRVGSVPY